MNNETEPTRHPFARSGSVPTGASHVARLGFYLPWAFLAATAVLGMPPASRAEEMKPDTLERVKHAAVLVFTKASKSSRGDTTLGSGSGFFINATGLAITNNHVVDPTHLKSREEKFQFHYKTGKLTWTIITDSGTDEEASWNALVLYQNESADQALLQVQDEDGNSLETPNYLRFQSESRLHERMPVWALGFPGGDKNRTADQEHPEVAVTVGNILEFPRTPGGRIRMIYTDVVARPGNSGGPMVDVDGYLLGTVTLMKPPEGREDTGGANYSALVPNMLTSQMIRNTFALGKMSAHTDVAPFADVLTREDGMFVVPDIERKADQEVLHYDDGDRIFGTIASDSITWQSQIGKLNIPVTAIAYIMAGSEGTELYLEGGDRIQASGTAASFAFKPNDGEVGNQSFDDISVVSFRTSGHRVSPVSGKVVILDTEVCRLAFSELKGKVKFKSRAGTLNIPLENIVRFFKEGRNKHVIELVDHRRLTGEFESTPIEAKLAATGTPISLDMSKLNYGTVEVQHRGGTSVAGSGLRDVLAAADHDVRAVAEMVLSDDPSGARSRIDEWLHPDKFRKMPDVEKDRIRLLDAVALLRDGRNKEASKALRRCLRASDANIAAYAQACAAVLKRFGDFQYNGKPLSDRATFIAAGRQLAREEINTVRDLLKDAANLKGTSRSEYVKGISAARKYEGSMRVAGVFTGPVADDELIRLWNFAKQRCLNEVQRIEATLAKADEERNSRRSSSRGGRRNAGGSNLAFQRKRDELAEQREDAENTYREFQIKLFEYGFRIEDPDIQAMREQQSDSP